MEGQKVSITLKQGKEKLPSLISQKLTTKSWWGLIFICNGDWVKYPFRNYCQSILSWQVRRGLQLYKNSYPKILEDVVPIVFPKLMYISLEGNKIQSIQCIFKLDCPVLQDLDLGVNKIISIKTLRKSKLLTLQRVNFSGNIINDYSYFSQMKWPKLSQIYLQYDKDKLVHQYINSFCKIQSTSLSCVAAWSKTRIKSRKAQQSLKKCRKQLVILPKLK